MPVVVQHLAPSTRRQPVGAAAALRLISAGGLALLVADCGGATLSGRHPSELKYGVASSPRVIPEGQPIPKGGGREMIGQPYVVAGRTYVPHPGKGYRREGWASWYGSAFHGRLTANGEIFDREAVAAAHPTLPLPSLVRVTNAANGKSLVVRVNDRGPYEAGRVIDVSERAAEALEFRRRGTTRVSVRYLGPAPIEGSDDGKLLATLRTGPEPPSSVTTLLASLPEPSADRSRDRGASDSRLASLQGRGRFDPGPPPRLAAVPAPPVRTAQAAPRLPLDIRPPRRADIEVD